MVQLPSFDFEKCGHFSISGLISDPSLLIIRFLPQQKEKEEIALPKEFFRLAMIPI
jgi:hypothetical protein